MNFCSECKTEVSEIAKSECVRLHIAPRCSFHLCEYIRSKRLELAPKVSMWLEEEAA